MTNAIIDTSNFNRARAEAERALVQAQQQLGTRLPQVATAASRTFSVTNGAIDLPGTAERFATGISSGQIAPAIRDIGINPAAAGAIAGGLDVIFAGGNVQNVLQGAVSGALNNVIAQSGIGDALNNAAAQFGISLPAVPGLPALGGAGGSLSGASGGASASARGGITRAGLPADSNVAPARTAIQDGAGTDVEITIDSFLQSLQGSLSSIAGAGGIGGLLGGMLNSLLSSTGLTGALGGLVSGLSEGLSNALGGLTDALGQAASGLMQGLGNAIQSIPGVGPAITSMTSAIGDFAGNLSSSYNNLSPALQEGVDGAIAAVGASVVNRVAPGLPRINPAVAGAAVAAVSFADNPVAQLNNIANTARNLDRRTFGETRDPTFANVASAASRAAREMQKNVQRTEDGNYQLIRDPEDAKANINNTVEVVNGELQPVSTSFIDNLNDIQLQSYETYGRILRSKFISYNSEAPDLAVQAYNEYIEFDSLRTPETKQFVSIIEPNDAALIKQLADRFLTFYRSSRSRYTLTNL